MELTVLECPQRNWCKNLKAQNDDFNAMCLQEISFRSYSVNLLNCIHMIKVQCLNVYHSVLKQNQSMRTFKAL